MSRHPSTFIRVVGVALTFSACKTGEVTTHNPPPPEPPLRANPPLPPPEVPPTANPPAPSSSLPTYESVPSPHPPGATNPPSPVLYVAREDGSCFKAWMGGMVPLPRDIQMAGGRVVATRAEAAGASAATEAQCPPGQPAQLLAAYDKLDPAVLPGAKKP